MEEQQRIYEEELFKIEQARQLEADNLKKELLAREEEAKRLEQEKRKITEEIQNFKILQSQL